MAIFVTIFFDVFLIFSRCQILVTFWGSIHSVPNIGRGISQYLLDLKEYIFWNNFSKKKICLKIRNDFLKEWYFGNRLVPAMETANRINTTFSHQTAKISIFWLFSKLDWPFKAWIERLSNFKKQILSFFVTVACTRLL